jgi:uncharacterized membrane protein YhhN
VISLLSIAALASGCVQIVADERGATRLTYLFKPLTTALIIVIALLAEAPASGSYQALVVAGLLFSLAGDVFLMLPSDRFREGLGSFLLAHLVYVAAFTTTSGFQLAPFALLLIALSGGFMFRALLPHLGAMRLPVAIYVTAIGAMLWQAAGQWLVIDASWAAFALVGAILFAASDSLLAWDRFRTPIAHRTIWVLGSYFPAQWLIALSVGGG